MLIEGKFLASIFEQEVPSGTVDGSNVTFTLSAVPAYDKSLHVYINGLIQRQGTDYTISSQTITMTSAPTSGSEVYACFIKRDA